MNLKYNRHLTIVVLGFAIVVFTISNAYAHNPTGLSVPGECEDFVDQPSTDHSLTILGTPTFLPGTDVDVEAATTDTGTGAGRVRIVAFVDSTLIHEALHILPSPSGSVMDTIQIPPTANPGDTLNIFACFESPGSTTGVGVTHHLNVQSLFVLPESAIGAIAIVGSSIATLVAFYGLRHRRSTI